MENKIIFIGNLDFAATEAELKSLLSKFGSVVSVRMKQKKGHAFIEMENAEEAAQAVAQLDGTKHKDRQIRLSLYLNARKARTVSVRQYKDRGVSLFKQRKETSAKPERDLIQDQFSSPGRQVADSRKPSSPRSQKPSSGFKPRERSTDSEARPFKSSSRERTGPARPSKKPWSADKPSYSGREASDSRKPGPGRSSKPSSGYKPSERTSASEARPFKSFSRERTGSARPPKRPWSAEKPSYSGRAASDSRKPDTARSPKPGSGFKPRERSAGSERGSFKSSSRERTGSERPLKKEWSPKWSSRPSVKTEDKRAGRPERNKAFGDQPRNSSKPRSANGPQNRSGKSSGGAASGRTSAGSTGSKPRGNFAGRGKPPKRDR